VVKKGAAMSYINKKLRSEGRGQVVKGDVRKIDRGI
jgi:hypothetical protein